MLTYYQTVTQGLLQNPGAPTTLYATADINRWINIARTQVAGESRCIRYLGTISTTISQRNYNFSSISVGSANGIQGVLHARSLRYAVGEGYQWVRPRPWEYFELYKLNNPVPGSGAPTTWSQYSQGGAGTGSITGIGAGSMASGSFFVDPLPDIIYALTLDTVCYPALMTADTDVEPIPFMFTDAVPYFAAYYALLSSQTGARTADAERYYTIYKEFMQRARMAANPDVLPSIYQGSDDPTKIAKLGLQKVVGGNA